MASGDVMNTAARIQSAAPVNGILVGELTYRATRDAIDYSEAEPIAAKGKSEPVRVWEAVEVSGAWRTCRGPTASRSSAASAELERAAGGPGARRSPSAGPSLVGVVGPPGSARAAFWRSSRGRSRRGRRCPLGAMPARTAKASPTGRSRRSSSRPPGSSRATTATRSSRSSTASSTTLPTQDLDALRTIAAALSNVIGIPTTPRGHLRRRRDRTGRAALGTA